MGGFSFRGGVVRSVIPCKYTSMQNPPPSREERVLHYQLRELNQNRQCNPEEKTIDFERRSQSRMFRGAEATNLLRGPGLGSVLYTRFFLVVNKSSQAKRTHPDFGLSMFVAGRAIFCCVMCPRDYHSIQRKHTFL